LRTNGKKRTFHIYKKAPREGKQIQGYLKVDVNFAKLPKEMDTHVKLQYGKVQFSTDIVRNSKKPMFNKSFVLEIHDTKESADNAMTIAICTGGGGKMAKLIASSSLNVTHVISKTGAELVTLDVAPKQQKKFGVEDKFQVYISCSYRSEKEIGMEKEKKR